MASGGVFKSKPLIFIAPPPAAYYHGKEEEAKARFAFPRFILKMLILLLVASIALGLFTWFIFAADLPAFHVDSMEVPSFNATDDQLTAAWDATITIKNLKNNVQLSFEYLEGIIVYDGVILGMSRVQPFAVGIRGDTLFNIKLSTEHGDRESLAGNYKNLVGDRRKGVIRFDLRMIAEMSIRTGLLWRRRGLVKVFCEDLKVQFAVGSDGAGKLVEQDGNEQYECFLYTNQ
ncbi:uncharacterized protein LOC127808639 [Diospyros lotus]|uniref:uncharacterized protein LOC127808639 n=1 Tax=Diospyros lotus TaxID=55363 RepID=UPI002256C559|nr:uncharacterized protein LOC127808639 [Diospyros lotus]